MGRFFIDTASGQIATQRQLREGGVIGPDDDDPPRPWHPVQGPSDASTMWYAVLRKRTRGIFIGMLVLRHGEHHASLVAGPDWDEVPIAEIGLATSERPGPPPASEPRQPM